MKRRINKKTSSWPKIDKNVDEDQTSIYMVNIVHFPFLPPKKRLKFNFQSHFMSQSYLIHLI